MNTLIEKSGQLPVIEDNIRRMVRETFPEITFTDIWVLPGVSSYGDEMVEVWAIYDGVVSDLQAPEELSIRPVARDPARVVQVSRVVQDMLWDMDLDASPMTHFITKSDAKDWRPEGV